MDYDDYEDDNRVRFNNALRSSAKSIKRESSNKDSWENNNFVSKYEERLDYKELLRNHQLG